jgi:glycosyltransferase involved in cell wall biosynthesis
VQYGLQRRARQRLAVAAALRLASRLTVCSEYQRRLARAHGAEPDLIPIGVDRALFTRASPLNGPPWRLVHVANLNPVKDQPALLHALKIVIEGGKDTHLDVAGLDTLDGSVQRLAAALGVASHVTFHGFLPTDRLVPLYQRAHLHVLSSRHEAAGVVALEAAACGVATVGTAVGYIADWSPDRAVAVPPGDSGALASGIVDLLQQHERRARLAAAAYDWAARFDADWTADAFESLYHELAVRSAV